MQKTSTMKVLPITGEEAVRLIKESDMHTTASRSKMFDVAKGRVSIDKEHVVAVELLSRAGTPYQVPGFQITDSKGNERVIPFYCLQEASPFLMNGEVKERPNLLRSKSTCSETIARLQDIQGKLTLHRERGSYLGSNGAAEFEWWTLEEPAAEPQQTEPQQTEPQQTEPQQTEPQQTEPQQTEPQQTSRRRRS